MKNFIKYTLIDGCPPKQPESKNGFITYYHGINFSQEIITIETDQILSYNDLVKTEYGGVRVQDRIYYPKDNHYDFILTDVFTGRRE